MSHGATIERIESFTPDRPIKIDEFAGPLGLRKTEIGVFRKIYGLDEVRFDPELGLFDLVLPAARRALGALPEGARVDLLIYAHTILSVSPPDVEPAQVLRDRLGLPHAEAFALNQQACVSSMAAIDVAAELLRDRGGGYALMVTGERAYSPAIQLIPHSTIMADAAAAALITVDGAGDEVLSNVTRTRGEFAAGLLMTDEEIQRFGKDYAGELAAAIQQAVAAAGLELPDVELIIPHNVNTISWKQTAKELDIAPSKVFTENIPKYGHCYSSDVFINYTTLREQDRLADGAHYVLASVGLGATFGAMVIRHRGR